MHIIVCTKQIRHTYARTGRSPDSHYINAEDNVYCVNPHDEAALELALRLKDKGDNITVSLLSLGPLIAPEGIRRCLAAGADEWYQIHMDGNDTQDSDPLSSDPLDQPDPWTKSGLFARAVIERNGDLVLCGKGSLDKGNGQVAAFLARRLDRPFVSAITDVTFDETEDCLQVQRIAGRGVREMIQCEMPAVCSVDLGADLRFPKFARRQWAGEYTPEQLNYHLDSNNQKSVCTRRFQPRPRTKIVPSPDSRKPAYERVMELLTGSTVEKKGEILTGSTESQVEGIITFLEANGFLESGNAEQ